MEETPKFSPNKKIEEKPTGKEPTPPPAEEVPAPTPPPAEEVPAPTPVERASLVKKEVPLPLEGKRIIVDFSEKEECVLGPANEVTFYEGTGVLTLENSCTSESLWNNNIELTQTEGTEDLRAGNYLAADLDAGNEWKKPYKLLSSSPILQIKEQIDTDFQGEGEPLDFTRRMLIFGEETSTIFQITITNRHQKPINKVVLMKEMPGPYEFPPRLLVPYQGEVEFDADKKRVTWTLTSLESEQPTTLSIVATITPKDVEPLETGMIEATYEVFGSNMVNIQPWVHSLCDVFFFVETAESDEPGQWHCTAEFEGNNELLTVLETVQISIDGNIVFADSPNEGLPAKGVWSADFQVQGEKPPIFQKEMNYYIPWIVRRSISSHIKKRADLTPIIKTMTEKTFDPPIVNTYARTLVNVDAKVTNVGSAAIDKIVFYDTIPEYFKIAEDSKPQVFLGEENVTQLVTIEPTDIVAKIEEEKSLKVTITELEDRYGGLKPDQTMSLRYTMEAAKPIPGRRYLAPLESEAFASPPSVVPAISNASTTRGPPEIELKYEKRAIGVGKAVRKTPDGRFQVRIRVKNNGGVPLESIMVKDSVPSDFECFDIEPKTIDTSERLEGDLKTITWHIHRLDSEDSLTLKFKVKGKPGEFIQKEPIVEVKG
ncbi:MAG: hypothetical protein ACE5R6_15020 [Candidatus Heimdallarchaeota archaeon]